jgi:hypothetical protein
MRETEGNGGSGSHAVLHARHQAVMPDWLALYYEQPIEIVRGEGRHVWDAEGRRYLDFFGGILTTMTAHALPEVTKAISEQAERILHSSTLYLNETMIELAERIAALSGIPDARVFFTPSGTEANDAALLLATAYRRSNQVLAMRNSYHGRSFTAVGITGNAGWSPTSLSPLQTLYVHGGLRNRGPFADLSDDEFIAACVADLEDLLGQTRGVAALIAEPIQGVGGFTSGPRELDPPAEIELTDSTPLNSFSVMQLHRLPVERLSDAQLSYVLNRALLIHHGGFLYRVLREVLNRPSCVEQIDVNRACVSLFDLCRNQNRREEAFEWAARGREHAQTAENAFERTLEWELRELALRSEDPEDPKLASLLNHLFHYYGRKLPELRQHLVSIVEEHGLPVPWEGGETAAEAEQAGSATAGGLWTPATSKEGERKLWLPGQD